MGLIKAAIGSVGGVLADQWKEFFYCDSLNENILMAKGQKRTSRHGRSGNTDGEDNIISNGSRIAVNNGQCMLIVESGKIVEVCAEPGEYTYDASTEASIFDGDYAGDLGESFRLLVRQMKERFAFGGDTGKDQRVYYVNLKEIIGNKYGTPSEVPFKSYDDTTGLALLMRLRCFGEYSYRIVNPILFYTNVAGNDVDVYERSRLDSQLKSELLTALQPAFARISALHIDYSQLPGHTPELAQALNEVLSPKWRDLRGIEIVSIGINSVKANEEDEEKIQKAQMGLTMSRPDIGLGTLVDATADSMRTAAANEGGMGAAMGYMGMNMANQAGAGLIGHIHAHIAHGSTHATFIGCSRAHGIGRRIDEGPQADIGPGHGQAHLSFLNLFFVFFIGFDTVDADRYDFDTPQVAPFRRQDFIQGLSQFRRMAGQLGIVDVQG